MKMRGERKKAAALRYTQGEGRAPRLVAKGAGDIAGRIVAIARESGIPIREDKVLVQALYVLDIETEIPPELYKAVAEILAFLYALDGKARASRRKTRPVGRPL